MAAAIGRGVQIGHYRVESKLGEGGMGSVYRALDTKLTRAVAIKVLSSTLADAAARRRFQREAQLASSLNHPHILTVLDVGEFEGRQYLVTEFVDGGTLKEWLKEKRGWQEIVDLLVGVADGLATAHAAGMIHRDIKPANILVTNNGYAKLADFGLAKLAEPATADETVTITEGRTAPGVIIGTIAYMSPEQATGLPLDARSDLFSFGVVLYEALTGKRPFAARNHMELLRAIIHDPAEPLPRDVPAPLRTLIERCMAKSPDQRYQLAREMVVDLKRCGRGQAVSVAAGPSKKTHRLWMAAAGLAAVGFAGWFFGRTRPTENPLNDAAFTRLTNFDGSETEVAISRDGRAVAFRSDHDGVVDTWVTEVGSTNPLNLTKGSQPVVLVGNTGFSPDGTEVYLSSVPAPGEPSRLRMIPIKGGTPRAFLAERAMEPAWSPDGTRIVYQTSDPSDPVFIADKSGGDRKQIYIAPSPGIHNHFLTWSKDAKWIYFVSGLWDTREIDIMRIRPEGGTAERLTNIGRDIRYLRPFDDRTLVYVAPDESGAGPWLWAFDTEQRTSRRWSPGPFVYTSVDVSADGSRLAAAVGNPIAKLSSFPILDRPAEEGDVKPYSVGMDRALAPRLNGNGLFFLSSAGGGDGLWRFANNKPAEIWRGSDGPLQEPAAVSPDGKRVAILLRKNGTRTLNLLSTEGGDAQPLAPKINVSSAAAWSPDGAWIVATGNDGSGAGLFKIPVDGGQPQRLMSGQASNPVWSPGGSVIAYAGPPLGAVGPLQLISKDGAPMDVPLIRVRTGGERYRFIPGTRQLVYLQGEQHSKVDFRVLDLSNMKTRSLTNFDNASTRTFDVTPDGKQIVFDRLRDNSDIVLIDLAKQP
jgi:serine/threonine protein kinase